MGRVAERHELKRAISEHRLVTSIGPGGIGKSRLAISVADRRGRPTPRWGVVRRPRACDRFGSGGRCNRRGRGNLSAVGRDAGRSPAAVAAWPGSPTTACSSSTAACESRHRVESRRSGSTAQEQLEATGEFADVERLDTRCGVARCCLTWRPAEPEDAWCERFDRLVDDAPSPRSCGAPSSHRSPCRRSGPGREAGRTTVAPRTAHGGAATVRAGGVPRSHRRRAKVTTCGLAAGAAATRCVVNDALPVAPCRSRHRNRHRRPLGRLCGLPGCRCTSIGAPGIMADKPTIRRGGHPPGRGPSNLRRLGPARGP